MATVQDGLATTLTGLKSGTEYAFWVYARDAAGNLSLTGLPITFTTLDGGPPTWLPGSTLLASDVTPHGLTLAWPPASDDVAVVSYRIEQDGLEVGTTDAHSWAVSDLQPWKNYAFAVRAQDGAGHVSETTLSITVKTQMKPPKWGEATLNVSELTATSLLLTWGKASDDAGVASYKLTRMARLLASPRRRLQFAVTGLTSWSDYDFEVLALDWAGNISVTPLSV